MKIRYAIGSLVFGVMVISVVAGSAIQQQPAQGGGGRGQGTAPAAGRGATAPPPISWPSPPLPAGPIVLDSGIQHQIRLFVTKGLNQPWSMAFLPDGAILITERPGRLRIVRNGVLDPTPVDGMPAVQAQGLAGLMDLALHPGFNENKFVYFTYHKPQAIASPPAAGAANAGRGGGGGGGGVITLAR
jgi:glucose/arabinose dehydrogenase